MACAWRNARTDPFPPLLEARLWLHPEDDSEEKQAAVRTQEKADAGLRSAEAFSSVSRPQQRTDFLGTARKGYEGSVAGAFTRLLGLFCFACCWNEWAPPLFSMKEPQAGYAQTDCHPSPPRVHPALLGDQEPLCSGGIFMDLNLQLVEGPHLLALLGHLGSGTFFVYLFSSPRSWGGRSCRPSLACVWFWGSLQPYLGPRWNLWPSSWRL